MNLVRCKNGHFYDSDKSGGQCPYCAQLNSAPGPADQPAPAPKTQPVPAPPRKEPAPAPAPAAPKAAPVPEPPQRADAAPAPKAPHPVPPAPAPATPFPDEDDNCTIGYYSRVIGVEPVVGWLVCTEGEYKGESFKLKSGRNFIGRAANMDVVLSADHSISRFKHAAVIYEPRSRQFIVTAGESRELCYLNGKVVLSNMEMKAYDVLNLGNTSLTLVPFCGSRFSWEEGPVKEEEKKD